MRYHKLKAGECPGTYVVTEPVTEQDLLRIANQIARKRLAKGSAITSTTEAAERLQTLLQDREHEVFGALFLDSQHRVLAFVSDLLIFYMFLQYSEKKYGMGY